MVAVSSREFNQHTSRAKRDAEQGPVVITDRGRPSHVLLSYDAYRRLTSAMPSLVELLGSQPDTADIELPLPAFDEPGAAAVLD